MQKVLGCGRLHRRRQCYTLCLSGLPSQAQPPLTVVDAAVCAAPCWEEIPCHERGTLMLRVTVPLSLRVRDGCGCTFTAQSSLEEQLCLRLSCPESECWRGQVAVQGAVRLCGNGCPCEQGCCETPLELLLEGFLLAPCTMGVPCPPSCPDPRPWYPRPGVETF